MYCADPGNQCNLVNRTNGTTNMGSHNVFSWHFIKQGVAILFPKKLEYKILEPYCDSEGRLLIAKFYIEKTIYILLKCYTPHTREYVNLESMTNKHNDNIYCLEIVSIITYV